MTNPAKKETHQPVQQFRLHGISGSLFENVSEQGTPFFKVTLSRTYKDGDAFKSTTVFGRDDLPIVASIAFQAWLAIMERESQSRPEKELA
jgi:hypothetical protein